MPSVLNKLWDHSKFFYENPINIDNQALQDTEVLEKLLPFISEERLQKFDEVLEERTHNFIPVMENLHDRGNISAAMRTGESFGFYNFCVIESPSKDKYKYSKRTARGAQKWCSVAEYTSSKECLGDLKDLGYQILTTHLSADAKPIQEVDFSKKTALVFGGEKDGISEEALKLSDANVIVPMYGFTQSFNISVAAALSFQVVHDIRKKSLGHSGDLTNDEKYWLRLNYIMLGIQNSKRILTSTSTPL